VSSARVCFLLERGRPPRLNPIFAESFELLRRRQIEVDVRFPEQELVSIDAMHVEADLYLLKSDTELALSLATALEYMGARVLNTARACRLAKDKLLAAITLARAGIPAPRALAASNPKQLRSVLSHGRLIFKPHRGYHGVGITVAERPSSLPDANRYPEVVFAQDYLTNARRDLKLYGIGQEVFGVRKGFGSTSFLENGEPTRLTPQLEQLAQRCAVAFGLELYGLDIAEDPDRGLQVIDVNYFPGYRGVPDAARRLADYIAGAVKANRCAMH
jgi:ribosomal protein S6--L-glutamate ligase